MSVLEGVVGARARDDAPATDLPGAPPAAGRRLRVPGWLLRTLSPLALLGLWQLGGSAGLLSAQVLPPPSTVLAGGLETWRDGTLAAALAVSGQRVVLGFALGAAVGLTLGVLTGLSKVLDTLVDPPLQMIRTVPFLGLIPLFIIWFGIGETPKVAMVALGVSFPLYLNASAAIRHVDPKLLETAQVLGFGWWQKVTVVVAPSALPQVLIGLRQSLGVAWLSLIVAEQINADAGLGYIINNANQTLRTDIVVFGLLVYALLGLLTDGLVRVLERRALSWRPAVAR